MWEKAEYCSEWVASIYKIFSRIWNCNEVVVYVNFYKAYIFLKLLKYQLFICEVAQKEGKKWLPNNSSTLIIANVI